MDTFIILFLSMLLGSGKAVCPVNDEPLKFPEYADSVFLEIKGNLYEHPEYIWQHQDIWTRAGERLEQHLFVENGRFVWDIEQGSDIKISENIFEWFTSTWKDGNEKLATGHFEIDTLDGRKWAVPKPGYNLLGEKIAPGKQEVMRIVIDTIAGKAQVAFQKEDTLAMDGTNFRDLSFDEGLAAARAEGKLLFVDCYTTWCGPCKNMTNNVFPQKAAGDYFNPRFVCIKVDMEKGEALPKGYAKAGKQLAALALTRMESQTDSLSAQDLELGNLILSGFLSKNDPESYARMANLIEKALPRLPEDRTKEMLQYTLEDCKRITNKKQ